MYLYPQANARAVRRRTDCDTLARFKIERFGENMTEIFNNKKNMGLRGSGAYKVASDFEIARRVGGGKSLDLRSEPPTETDRALSNSRELLARLRQMATGKE